MEKSLATSTRGRAVVREIADSWLGLSQPRGRFVASILCVLCAVAGCTSKSPCDITPVHGKVTIAGQPLSGGKVVFAPIAQAAGQNAGKAAIGLVQPGGQYVLMTYEDGDGAIVGEHWVTVFVPDTSPQPPPEPGDVPSTTPTYKRRAVPQKQIVVAGQDNEINVAL
jgi:hypothetical protein